MNERTNEPSPSANPLDVAHHAPIESARRPVPSPGAEPPGRRRRTGVIRRFFWLDEQIGDIAHAGRTAEHSGWREVEGARQARQALLRLSDLRASNTAILTLRRVEALELVQATLKRHGVDCPGAHLSDQDWDKAEGIDEVRQLRARLSAEQYASLVASLSENGQSYLLGLSPSGRRRVARSLARSAQQLSEPFFRDRKAIERLRLRRWLRSGFALLVLLVLCGIGLSRIHKGTPTDNLALHRSVKVSTSAGAAYDDTDRLVDGDVRNLGFHTAGDDPHPWVIIDLGTSQRFKKVVVYNREDCCQERAVPLTLEASDDGTRYERLAERLEPFDKWTVKDLNARARFVRLRPQGSGMFHLAEVEIYP